MADIAHKGVTLVIVAALLLGSCLMDKLNVSLFSWKRTKLLVLKHPRFCGQLRYHLFFFFFFFPSPFPCCSLQFQQIAHQLGAWIKRLQGTIFFRL